jgi:energy-coupling factor transport system permease protein
VAWTFVPQTVAAFRATREAQAARGYRLRGARDLLPLLVPLLTGGMERAVTLSEVLESRGFGATLAVEARPRPWRGVALALGLAAGAAAGYLLAAGRTREALAASVGAGVLLLAIGRDGGGNRPRRTRYREVAWTGADSLVAGTAALAIVSQTLVLALDPAAFRYEPYPELAWPRVSLPLLVGVSLLLAPVAVAPVEAREEGTDSPTRTPPPRRAAPPRPELGDPILGGATTRSAPSGADPGLRP